MPEIRKSSAPVSAGGVVYDLARSRERVPAPATVHPVDAAGISEMGRERARTLSVVESAPEVRAEKVRALRAKISSGKYTPDAREVAAAILRRGI